MPLLSMSPVEWPSLGHHWASITAPLDSLAFIKGEENVSWYRASDYARRGSCKTCATSLFWHGDKLDEYKDRIGVSAGAIVGNTGAQIKEHIFVADKGDYYQLVDGVPQKETF
ncbi:MAG: GFA family protein [Parvibaculaceae bacterium]|nr:GFA family protein [Parvibaculaceae bacterium]